MQRKHDTIHKLLHYRKVYTSTTTTDYDSRKTRDHVGEPSHTLRPTPPDCLFRLLVLHQSADVSRSLRGMESSTDVGELAFQLSAGIIQDRTSGTRLALATGVVRGRAIYGALIGGRGVQYLITGRHRKAEARLERFFRIRALLTNLSCLRIWPAARAWARTSARKAWTSSTIKRFIPSIESSSSKPKSKGWKQIAEVSLGSLEDGSLNTHGSAHRFIGGIVPHSKVRVVQCLLTCNTFSGIKMEKLRE